MRRIVVVGGSIVAVTAAQSPAVAPTPPFTVVPALAEPFPLAAYYAGLGRCSPRTPGPAMTSANRDVVRRCGVGMTVAKQTGKPADVLTRLL